MGGKDISHEWLQKKLKILHDVNFTLIYSDDKSPILSAIWLGLVGFVKMCKFVEKKN
jgi:hypothetical protein